MSKATRASLATCLLLTLVAVTPSALSAPDDQLANNQANSSAATAGGQWTIVATYAIPEGASGLAYDGTWLYCGIYGVNGDQIYRIDPADGSYSLLMTGPQEDAFGLTFDGTHLWTTDHPGSSSTPAVAMQLDWSGNLIGQFDMPTHYMSGIAHDPPNFYVTQYYPDPSVVYHVDATGAILNQFTAPDDQPWDIAVHGTDLWIADYWGDTLYKVKASDGSFLESHPSEGTDPAGIAWDGAYLWYCDNGEGGNDYLYKVDLAGAGSPEIIVPITTHDYGPVVIGDPTTWNTTVQNNGESDLIIDDVTFTPPADLTNPDVLPITIPPAGNAQLALVYTPTGFAAMDAVATISSNDPIHPETDITLSGHGVYLGPTIDILEPSHDFGQVRVNATTRWYMTVRNSGSETLTVSNITSDDAHFYIDDTAAFPIAIATLATVDIGIWFNPTSPNPFAGTVTVHSDDPGAATTDAACSGEGLCANYFAGDTLWSHLIDTSFDNSPKAIAPIPDVSGDGVADVIVCAEDDYVRCFNGASDAAGDILWEHEIYGGAIYAQNALQITDDIDGDGISDLVVGAAWAADLIRALSGQTGEELWTHDTHEYGDGGWVYALDAKHDYNDDGIADVLAVAGDDASDTGPKRAYCLNGLTGISIWETPLGGAGFSVVSVDDFNGDGQADAVAGASNADETQGLVFGIDGSNGSISWSFPTSSSSVWAVEQLHDITGDGIRDIIAADFSGNVYGLDATNGNQEYAIGAYGTTIRLERLDDITADGNPDFIAAHFGTSARAIDAKDGTAVWTTPLVDKSAAVDRIADVTGDGINDVVVGTLFGSNYVYLLDGADGAVVQSLNYGTPLDAIAAMPDIVGDGMWEIVAGGRSGLVTAIAGTDANPCGTPPPPARPMADDAFNISDAVVTCSSDADCQTAANNPDTQAYCVPAPTGDASPGICYVPRNRYISINPNPANAGTNTARRLSIDLGGGSTAVLGWIAAPVELAIVGPETPTQLMTGLADAPYYRDWNVNDLQEPWTDATLHVGACQISPSYVYLVESINEGMNTSNQSNYSEALTLRTTTSYGNVAGPNLGDPPDGNRNFKDISAVVRGFQSVQTEPKVWLDLVGPGTTPECPSFDSINFGDITAAVSGFQGNNYPHAAPTDCAPDPCSP